MGAEEILREPVGAEWVRVDLHLHTPGVSSFRFPGGADVESEKGRRDIASRYVDALAAARVAFGAITDYNGIRDPWFGLIRDLAGARGIRLLPGAELSFQEGEHGLHVLAIFPESADADSINRAVDSLDRDPGDSLRRRDRSHRDIRAIGSLVEALRRLREQTGCLLIFPHPTNEKGLLKTFRPKGAATLLAELDPDALEACPEAGLERLLDTGIVRRERLGRLALIECSDPKSIEQVGHARQPTYLKLSVCDLAALRLALRDPETRLAIGAPPRPAHNRILGFEVEGTGFLGGLRLRWNDELNVLIGGRGVGKSAILETLRYALAMAPYAEESYDDLVRHALGSGGKVTLLLERALNGDRARRYRVERVLGESPRVVDLEAAAAVQVPPVDVFGPAGAPTIFGQREIYFVAMSEQYRLRLLDDLIGEEARARERSVREAVERLQASARAILEHQKRLGRREEYRQKLQNIEHEIDTYEKHGVAQKLREATALKTDGQHLARTAAGLEEVRAGWGEAARGAGERLERIIRDLRRGQSSQKTILDEAARHIESLRDDLAGLAARATELLERAEAALAALRERWAAAVSPLEEELNLVKRALRTEALDPDRLLQLTEEKTALAPLVEELGRVESEIETLRSQRARLLSDYRDRRYEAQVLRRERAAAVRDRLGGRLQLLVEFKGQKEEAYRRLTGLLRGSSRHGGSDPEARGARGR